MATDQSFDVQEAIFAALDGDAILGALIQGVFDQTPQDSEYPYVVVGDDTSIEDDTKNTYGQEHTLTLHTWWQTRGRKAGKDIMARVYTLLHDQILSLSVGTMINMSWEFAQTFRDPDGVSYHGVQRFRVITEN